MKNKDNIIIKNFYSPVSNNRCHLIGHNKDADIEALELIYAFRRTEHVTPLLHDLYWLRYPERIYYKLAMLVYRCLHGLAPSYLTDEFMCVSEIESRWNHRPISLCLIFSGRHLTVLHSCGSGSNMEQLTVTCHIIFIIDVIQTQSQD